jgi:hypothetical protein
MANPNRGRVLPPPHRGKVVLLRRGQGRAGTLVLLAVHRSVCPRGASKDDPDGVDRLGIARYVLIDVEQDRCGLLYERLFGIA